MKRWLSLLLVALVMLSSGSAQALSIAILRPSSPAPPVAEAVHRLREELFALGLDVKLVGRAQGESDGDARAGPPQTTAARGFDALIEVAGESSPSAVNIWIFEPSSQTFRLSRVVIAADSANAAETLAIRAIEVLRSNFVEIDLAALARSRAPLASQAREQSPAPPPRPRPDFGLGAGVAVLGSLDGIGPAIMPVVQFDWVVSPWLIVQATLAGLGTRPTIESSVGSASVLQSYGLLGVSYSPFDSALRPFVSLSAGSLRTSLEGEANPPERGEDVTQWSFLVDAGLGVRLGFGERFHVSSAFHVALAEPYVAVHFVDEEVASTGRPNLVASLTFGAWL